MSQFLLCNEAVPRQESWLQTRCYHPIALSQEAHRQHRRVGAVGSKGPKALT